MITNERSAMLSAYLEANKDHLPELLELEPAEFQATINAAGNDFTLEEVTSYAQNVEKFLNQQEGELSEDDLDEVAGGFDPFTVAFLVGVSIVLIATSRGKKLRW